MCIFLKLTIWFASFSKGMKSSYHTTSRISTLNPSERFKTTCWCHTYIMTFMVKSCLKHLCARWNKSGTSSHSVHQEIHSRQFTKEELPPMRRNTLICLWTFKSSLRAIVRTRYWKETTFGCSTFPGPSRSSLTTNIFWDRKSTSTLKKTKYCRVWSKTKLSKFLERSIKLLRLVLWKTVSRNRYGSRLRWADRMAKDLGTRARRQKDDATSGKFLHLYQKLSTSTITSHNSSKGNFSTG